jgi:hypothetical protein
MGRKKLISNRKPFSLRLPQEIINDSKSIPHFRKNLEDFAIEKHSIWKKKELILNE